ncbi:MAG: VTT domain-containing protein [Rhodobacteraceae bacterium]|nr:VTT domain-containing protein [Paracoccaceae bacterium]
MTDMILAMVPTYGLPLLAAVVFLSCLALPVPSSLAMLTSGSFVGAGDLALVPTVLTALFAALAGDQTGYLIGRKAGAPALRWLARKRDRKVLIARARAWIARRGGIGVFLSRWLFSPLGPYVNLIGGATGLGWTRFTLWGAAGEAVWVAMYVGLGVVFAGNIAAGAELAADFSGILAGGAISLFLGLRLVALGRRHRHRAAARLK